MMKHQHQMKSEATKSFIVYTLFIIEIYGAVMCCFDCHLTSRFQGFSRELLLFKHLQGFIAISSSLRLVMKFTNFLVVLSCLGKVAEIFTGKCFHVDQFQLPAAPRNLSLRTFSRFSLNELALDLNVASSSSTYLHWIHSIFQRMNFSSTTLASHKSKNPLHAVKLY